MAARSAPGSPEVDQDDLVCAHGLLEVGRVGAPWRHRPVVLLDVRHEEEFDAAGRTPVAVDDDFENAGKAGLHLVGPQA